MWTENGFVPDDFNTIMNYYYEAFKGSKPEFSSLTITDFNGSREYELFYASVQIDMQAQAMYAETFVKIANFITTINLKIKSPSTVPEAIVSSLKSDLGLDASVKKAIEADRGKLYIAIDYTPSAEINDAIGQHLKQYSVVGGVVTMGDISVNVALSNGQSFDYKWTTATAKPVQWRVTITKSRTTNAPSDTVTAVVKKFNDNLKLFYRIGRDIEPERYYEINRDAPYASNILTEYSLDNGSSWSSAVKEMSFNEKLDGQLEPSGVVFVSS